MPKKRSDSGKAKARKASGVGIGMLLRGANMEYNRLLRVNLGVYAITFSEFQHLWRLWDEDGLSQVELARRLGLPKAASTAVLGGLEARGLIARRRDETDRRRSLIDLTVAGHAIRDDLTNCARRANDVARRGLDEVDIVRLFEILQRVTDNLTSARQDRA